MDEGTCWVGLDVHASRTSVAVIDTATGEITKRTVLGRPCHEVIEFLEQLPGRVRAVYEAGPTGYQPRVGAASSLRRQAISRTALVV